MAEPFRCMASGQRGRLLALRLTPTALGHFSSPILLDAGAVAGLIESALTIAEAGLETVEEDDEW